MPLAHPIATQCCMRRRVVKKGEESLKTKKR